MKEQTDKVLGFHGYVGHNYGLLYDSILPLYHSRQRVKFLEIGLGCDMKYGVGHSVPVWLQYFSQVPDFQLWFAESDEKCGRIWNAKPENQHVNLVYGDQADVNVLHQWIQQSNSLLDPFDIIIDDGGHTWKQKTNSFRTLWAAVAPGGVYVLEGF